MGLPNISIQRPVFAAMVFTGLAILGIISLIRLPVELYQGQNQGIISIIVRARGGLPPLEVEKTITKPIETAVASVAHLKNLYSNSREAESRVTMEFEPGTDMNFAALEIREKFARVLPLLPREIEKPVIANYDDAEAAIFVFALTSETLPPEEIRNIVESELKPILARVNGVASVEVYGGRARKILIELDRDKMIAYNISIEMVMDIIGQNNVNLLAGNIEKGQLEFAVRSMGAFTDVAEIGNLGIHATRQGSIIPLKEIATVKDAYMEPEDEARLNLEQNVTVYVKKTSLANTIPIAKNVRIVLDEFENLHKEDFNIIIVTDKATTISKAIADVRDALLIGMVLTVIIIYLFLRKWVLAIIIALAIPSSVITTFFAMDMFHISINVMSLSGLALAIGVLVDSSVVVMENIFVKKERGHDDLHAIREGAEEVWLPLLTSLISTLIVFLPVIFVDKKTQMTYSGFALTVSASLVISFFVALMLVPMLMTQFARGRIDSGSAEGAEKGPSLFRRIYRKVMELNFSWRIPIVILLVMAFLFSTWRLIKRDIDWPNTMEENEFAIVVFPLAGARLEINDDAVKKVEEMLSKIPDVEMFSSTIRKDDVKIFVRLKPKARRQHSKDSVMKLLDEKGNEIVKQIHDEYSLIIDEGVSSSEQRKLVINIFGHENSVLEKLATEVANRIGKIPGLSNLVMTDLRKRPEYSLVVDKGRAALYGITVRDVADSTHAQIRGMRPTKFHELEKGDEIETITRLQAIYRQKIEDLRYVPVGTRDGLQIPLGEIANFYPSVGPQTIDRMDKYRYVFVKGDVKRSIETIAREIKTALRDLQMPEDYYWRFGGGYDELMEGKSELSMALILTIFLVYMVLACMFQSYTQPFLIMLSVLMATIGVWLALTLTGKPLSQTVFIGMILLAGYVVNPGIILMDHANRLRRESPDTLKEVLIRAGLDRLRPILMTTSSTICGFLPMALNWGQSSNLWSPLAITVIGGLLSSTILTLFVLPDFILILEDIKGFPHRVIGFFRNFFFRLMPGH